jgi:Uma2 family endonuclease
MTAIPLENEIFYPESDGEPMAETEIHLFEMIYCIEALRLRFEAAADVYVGGNLFLYYEKGNREAVVAPDAFVVKGVPKLPPRRSYRLWQEGKAPCFALEITSDSTRQLDLSRKMDVYQKLGIEEYFLFDPLGDYLDPRLQGYRLARGRYRPVLPGPDGTLASIALGLTFLPEENRLRLVDTLTGEPLLRREEETALRRRAEVLAKREAARADREAARADWEAEARRQAEERVRALEEEITRLRRASE